MRRSEYLLEALQDMRHGLRQLRRRPAFAAAVILTLGVGIGATTTVWSAADHVLLRPLPYADPSRVVVLWETDARTGSTRAVSPANFLEWKRRSTSFEHIGMAEPWGSDLVRSDGPPDELPAWRVSEGFLEALGATPALGRRFVAEEFAGTAASPTVPGLFTSHAGTGRSVVISHDLWQSRFGADPGLIGRTVLIDDVARTVVGVLPSGVEYPQARQLWLPKLFTEKEREERTATYMEVVARLRAGVALDQAQAEMDAVAAALADEYPATNAETGVRLVPLEEQVLGEVRPALLVLLAAVAAVLLVACANVAGLMLARSATRRRELGIRAALGAGRPRLVRQLVTESLSIGLLGGVVGVLLAALGLRALVGLAPADLPRLETVELDSRVLVFAATVSLLAAFLSGLIPALRFSRPESVAALRSGDRSASSGPEGSWFRSVLVVGEVAIALALLIGAGLLGRSFLRLLESDLGFETENRAAVQAFIWDRNPTAAQRLQRAAEIVERMEALPGVEQVAIAASVPFLPSAHYAPTPIRIEGRPQPPSGQELRAKPNMVSPSYFEVLAIPLLAGRVFDATDREDAPRVALVSESLAKRHFPDDDAIGETVSFEDGAKREIVGVVADIRHRSLDTELEPEIYVPFAQSAWGSLVFLAATEADVRSLLPRLREAIWEVDPGQAVPVSSSMDDLVGETLVARRFNLLLLGAFAAMALTLAAIGIYGLISFSTSRRTHEIGIRMALGSRRVDVLLMILGQGLRLGVVGIALGIGLALLLTGLLESMLYGVRSTDVWTYGALALFMLALTVAATYLPALRAARLDPVKALREE